MPVDRSNLDFPETYNAWIFCFHRWFGSKRRCYGFSPGGHIYYSLPEQYIPDTLKAHERYHWWDFQTEGIWKARWNYVREWIKQEFKVTPISYEVRAREAEKTPHLWVKP